MYTQDMGDLHHILTDLHVNLRIQQRPPQPLLLLLGLSQGGAAGMELTLEL
jgi:hypothetical protein